jgi:phosphoribosylaminoimidazole-succinocarboxamide synthase
MKGVLIYEGKAKKIFSVIGDETKVLIEFKDSLTAFNAQKTGSFRGKGMLNCAITKMIYDFLAFSNISHHIIEIMDEHTLICKKTRIIPIEIVVRNYLAGSLSKKLGRSEGERLKFPVIEFYLKSDVLNDPFINEDHALVFGWANQNEIDIIKKQSLLINSVLCNLFDEAGINLIDFKIEFGVDTDGHVLLCDEISPDCMRLWDKITNEKMDKDRFRRDLGEIDKAYTEVLKRLERVIDDKNRS